MTRFRIISSITLKTRAQFFVFFNLFFVFFISAFVANKGNNNRLEYIIPALTYTIDCWTTISIRRNGNNCSAVSAIILKLGIVPCHYWYPIIVQITRWTNCFLLPTWQEVAPRWWRICICYVWRCRVDRHTWWRKLESFHRSAASATDAAARHPCDHSVWME